MLLHRVRRRTGRKVAGMLAFLPVLVPVLQGCGGGASNWTGAGLSSTAGGGAGGSNGGGILPVPNRIQVQGKAEVPQGSTLDLSRATVSLGYNGTVPVGQDGAFTGMLAENAPTMVVLRDSSVNPVLWGIAQQASGKSDSPVAISAATTAAALVFMSEMLFALPRSHYAQALDIIGGVRQVQALATLIGQKVKTNSQALVSNTWDTDLTAAFKATLQPVHAALLASPLANDFSRPSATDWLPSRRCDSSRNRAETSVVVDPPAAQSGLTLYRGPDPTHVAGSTAMSLLYQNTKQRFATAKVSGEGVPPTTTWLDSSGGLLAGFAPAFGIIKPDPLPIPGSGVAQLNLKAKVFGGLYPFAIGDLHGDDNVDWLLPGSLNLVFNFILPVTGLLTGLDLTPETAPDVLVRISAKLLDEMGPSLAQFMADLTTGPPQDIQEFITRTGHWFLELMIGVLIDKVTVWLPPLLEQFFGAQAAATLITGIVSTLAQYALPGVGQLILLAKAGWWIATDGLVLMDALLAKPVEAWTITVTSPATGTVAVIAD